MSPNKNGTHQDFRHREPIPELQLITKILRRLRASTMSIPCTSLSKAKLNFDLLVVKFRSGHTRDQRHVVDLKVYPPCPNFNVTQGDPAHILVCISGYKSRLLFGLAIHQNDHQARRRFVEWAQTEIAVVPDFHKRILFSDEAHFWLNGYVNKQNCRIWSEANPQVYVETPLHPEKLTVWCALWVGGILLQNR
ncbi:hypothetical protein TNCV_4074461 [Trichonephila clavipes]|uniref:Uncharacterized protein n=1 Tax=Trichonephila clavipes TaxID=2585209 RepID=A0A8X6W8B2_TRICX|nr:hypothetical protein TNCV_4074461 [Trichonephila clavipes]